MLSNKLKNLRNTTNLTQSEFAKKIDVARTTYAMYEQGHREPDYDTLQRIADYYEVSTDYLLGRIDEAFAVPFSVVSKMEKTPPYKHIGNGIRKRLNAKSISDHSAMELLQINKIDYDSLLEGEIAATNKQAEILATLLDGRPEWFLPYVDEFATGFEAGVGSNLTTEEEFQAFANDPELGRWYKELPKSEEEDLQKLRQMWEIIRSDKKNK